MLTRPGDGEKVQFQRRLAGPWNSALRGIPSHGRQMQRAHHVKRDVPHVN